MHEPLKNITYLGKKLLFNFLGTDYLAPKSGHRSKKQPVLGPDITFPTVKGTFPLALSVQFCIMDNFAEFQL